MRRLHCSILIGLLACGSVSASVPASRYDVIPSRNLFGLRIPEKPAVHEPAPVNAPPVFLAGITTILGYKQALLRVQKPASPGQQAGEQSIILSEGQREEGVEVLRINEEAGQVTILNAGARMTLDFDRNGVMPRNSSPTLPVSMRQTATNHTPMRILPGRMPRTAYSPATNSAVPTFASPAGYSQSRIYASTNSYDAYAQPGGTTGVQTNITTVTPGFYTAPATSSSTATVPTTTLTPQEQVIVSELERAAAMEAISGRNPDTGSLPPPALPPDPVVPGPVRPAIPPFPPVGNY